MEYTQKKADDARHKYKVGSMIRSINEKSINRSDEVTVIC